jgi:Tfp pilus assembly protein PilW
MSDQMWAIGLLGGFVVVFGVFSSYMASRQKAREQCEQQGRQATH